MARGLLTPDNSTSAARPCKRWHRVVLCLLFACLFFYIAIAQDAGSATAQQYRLSGTVTNEATGEPIPRALVTLSSVPQRTAFTDSSGTFSIDGVAAGRYTLFAQKPGFFGQQERPSRASQFVDVGPNTDSANLKLAPEGVIYGRLTDANGQPIESVGVRLIRRTARNGRMRWEARGYTSTDDEGSFRFPSLLPGTYYISAGPEVAQPQAIFTEPEQSRTGWPGLYFPGVPDLASAAPINVTAGQQIQADMVMNRMPLYTISGMLSGNMPGQGVSLQVQNPSGDAVGVGTSFHPDTGQFEIHLPAGNYRLRAFSQAGEQQLRADFRLNVSRDLTQLHIPLQPAVSIPIHARMQDRASDSSYAGRRPGISGARYSGDLPPLSLHLISNDPGGSDVYSTVMGTDGNRSLVLRGIDPGRYTVELLPYSAWYVESAQCGNANVLTEDLVITAGDACSMEISLRNDSGTLSAMVKASGSGAGGTALLMPARGRGAARTVPFYTSDNSKSASIQFSLTGIAPGDYVFYAFDNVDSVEYSNPEALRPYSSQGTPVTISPGQTAKVTVQLIQTGAEAQ